MKFIAIGDLHVTLDKSEYIGGAFTAYLKELIACERPDALVFLGDILDYDCGQVSVDAMDCATRLFVDASALVSTYVLAGNHDYINPHQFLGDRHWMNSLKGRPNLTIIDAPARAKEAIFMPYVSTGRFMEALDTLPNWRAANIIFAHQGFVGASWHGGEIQEGDQWSSDLPPVVSGHIHHPQVLASGVHYSGSIDPSKPNQLIVVEDGEIRPIKMGRLTAAKWTGTVAELVDEKLNNREVLLQDSAETLRAFKATAEFAALAANNVVRCVAHTVPFLDLYRLNILDTGDVYVYCAAEKVLAGIDQNEQDHLFVSRGAPQALRER